MPSILTISIYYWIIIFSIVGHGILFNRFFLKSFEVDIGLIGIYGIFILIFVSYISSFFFPHTELFNSFLLSIGLINLFLNRNRNIVKNNIKKLIIIFSILIIFVFVSKNHDDFPYYHFPYTHLLTEYSNLIGLGNFNHGFRTHSSIFYLSSLFNLPFTNFYLLHLSPVFFLGFANIIFYNKILHHLNYQKNLYILYLSLLSLIFINIFFYRLAEHGTDRSAMILIIVTVVELFYLINIKKNKDHNLFLKLLILITLIISLKTFYILYVLLLIPVIFYFIVNKISLIFFFKKTVTYLCLIIFFIILLVNFFNSGCLLYPVQITCFENFSWSIPISEVDQMNNWYQQWAKAGANPNYRVENPEIYIKDFNWISNWIDKYFFNKVSDFLLGLIFLCVVVASTFFTKKYKKSQKPKFWLIYGIIIFLLLEWFYLLPALRYGGYHLIALLFFIPLSIHLSGYSINLQSLNKKIFFLLSLTIVVFLSRNILRLVNEHEQYGYSLINNAYYSNNGQNFKVFNQIQNLNKCNSKSNSIVCSENNISLKFVNNAYIFYRNEK
tara:strand:+ start:2503 stop:4164 length:1662 start_codon:yes stop_codon:yes gene_type:complete